MTETLNMLLDELAEYLELPDTACLSLPPRPISRRSSTSLR